ncbi:MAG: hypothetical protein RR400_00425 [Clostridia bacterium]
MKRDKTVLTMKKFDVFVQRRLLLEEKIKVLKEEFKKDFSKGEDISFLQTTLVEVTSELKVLNEKIDDIISALNNGGLA